MRVVPQFYPTIVATHLKPGLPAGPILLSAASQEAHSSKPGLIKLANVPPQVTEIAVDPGGFVAAQKGGYKFSWPDYRTWLRSLGPRLTWAAFPDLPCEKEIASDGCAVRARQEQTLEWAHDFWNCPDPDENGWIDDTEDGVGMRDVTEQWAWVPTIQGREIGEYLWMAERMAPLLDSFNRNYASVLDPHHSDLYFSGSDEEYERNQPIVEWAFKAWTHHRIGIGSLCKRPANEIVPVVRAISEVLPHTRFHLWGIDLRALKLIQRAGLIDCVASFDSSSYNGRFKGARKRIDAERKAMNMTQAGHAVGVLLPRRQKRIDGILAQSTIDDFMNSEGDTDEQYIA